MADENRTTSDHLDWLAAFEEHPGEFDFHTALRRLECIFRKEPRFGESHRPSEESIRLEQDPSLAFVGSVFSSVTRAENAPIRISNAFFGLFGSHGPLPLHLTEYVRDRVRNAGDTTFARFADVFHHRMLLLFYRAWAIGQPTVASDRPELNRFDAYLGGLCGFGLGSLRGQAGIPYATKLYYGGQLLHPSRNAEGLRAIVADYFRIPTLVEEFVGEWLDVPQSERWQLGGPRDASLLGYSTLLGARVWQCDHRVRVVLGPLTPDDFQSFLPGGDRLRKLAALLRTYLGDEYVWDVRLVLASGEEHRLRLGSAARLGWTSTLGSPSDQDLVVDPARGETRRISKRARGWVRVPCGPIALGFEGSDADVRRRNV